VYLKDVLFVIRSLRLIATFLIAACAISAGASAQKPAKSAKHKASTKHSKATPSSPSAGPLYATRPEVMAIADDIAMRRNLDREWVRHAIGESRMLVSVVRAMTPPAVGTPKNWAVYRSRFVEPIRIKAGIKFWQDNRDTLERAERETGVPASIIVGIVGVETIYGQQTGTYRVMDALSTLAFDFPSAHPRKTERAAFFLSELEAYLSLTARTRTDPLALRGSYAGAMGLPQFMPSSWSKHAIDFDGDSRVDLFNSAADVIGSVANYFVAFKWQRGMPTHYPVQFDTARLDRATLLAPDIVPSFTPQAMADKGVLLDIDALAHPGKLALVELQNGADAPLYIAGTDNFYAITRYNWSSYYALAVIELGEAVAAAVQAAPAVPK
jgi:membrane-bound lytic murein transglycosylase B